MKRLTAVLLLIGIAVLAGLIVHIGAAELVAQLRMVGGNLFWVWLSSVPIYVFDAIGWRYTLGRHAAQVPFGRLFTMRMAGEAVNFTTPAAYLGGEPMKAYLLSRHRVPLVDGLASVITAKTTMTLAEVLFIVMGVGIAMALLNRSRDLILTVVVGLGMLGIAISLFLIFQHRGLFGGMLRLLERMGIRVGWLLQREQKLLAVDEAIRGFYVRDRRGFAWSFFWFFLGWAVGSLEVYLIFFFLGQPVTLLGAFALEALVVFIKGGTAFIPGSVGGQEAGTVVVFVAFGYPAPVGVTFALIRRAREIFWTVFGLLALAMENRRGYVPDQFGRPPA
jgi:uncharacterized protein (TIRG00374 family)